MSVDSAVEDCRKWQLSKTIGNPIIRHRSKSAKIETPPRYRYGKMRNKIQQGARDSPPRDDRGIYAIDIETGKWDTDDVDKQLKLMNVDVL